MSASSWVIAALVVAWVIEYVRRSNACRQRDEAREAIDSVRESRNDCREESRRYREMYDRAREQRTKFMVRALRAERALDRLLDVDAAVSAIPLDPAVGATDSPPARDAAVPNDPARS